MVSLRLLSQDRRRYISPRNHFFTSSCGKGTTLQKEGKQGVKDQFTPEKNMVKAKIKLKMIAVTLVILLLAQGNSGGSQRSAPMFTEQTLGSYVSSAGMLKTYFSQNEPTFEEISDRAAKSRLKKIFLERRLEFRKWKMSKSGFLPALSITLVVLFQALQPNLGKSAVNLLSPFQIVFLISLFMFVKSLITLHRHGGYRIVFKEKLPRLEFFLLGGFVLLYVIQEVGRLFLLGQSRTVSFFVLLLAFQRLFTYFFSVALKQENFSQRSAAITLVVGGFMFGLFLYGGAWPDWSVAFWIVAGLFLLADAFYRIFTRQMEKRHAMPKLLFLYSVSLLLVSIAGIGAHFVHTRGFSPAMLASFPAFHILAVAATYAMLRNLAVSNNIRAYRYFVPSKVAAISALATPLAILASFIFRSSKSLEGSQLVSAVVFAVGAYFLGKDPKNPIGSDNGNAEVDLHIVSNVSQNASSTKMLSPEEIVDIACAKKLKTFSIADHHTISGVLRALVHLEEAGNSTGTSIIPAVEIHTNEGIHILVYFPDTEAFRGVADRIDGDLAPLRDEKTGQKWSVDETIAWARGLNLGAVTIWAHPGTEKGQAIITKPVDEKKLYDMFSRGLDGIEADSLLFRSHDVVRYLAMVQNYNWYHPDEPKIFTVGSDFHTPEKIKFKRQDNGKAKDVWIESEIGRGARLKKHSPYAFSWDNRIAENLRNLSKQKRQTPARLQSNAKGKISIPRVLVDRASPWPAYTNRVDMRASSSGFSTEQLVTQAAANGVQVLAVSDPFNIGKEHSLEKAYQWLKNSHHDSSKPEPFLIPSLTVTTRDGEQVAVYFPDIEHFMKNYEKDISQGLENLGNLSLKQISVWAHRSNGVAILLLSKYEVTAKRMKALRETLKEEWFDGLEIDKSSFRSRHRMRLLAELTLSNIEILLRRNRKGFHQKIMSVGSSPKGKVGIGWDGRELLSHRNNSWGIAPAEQIVMVARERTRERNPRTVLMERGIYLAA